MLDIEKDTKILLILGRSFLKTALTIINVNGGKMILRSRDDSIEFHLASKILYPLEAKNCWTIVEVETSKVKNMNEILSYPTLDEYVEKMQ